MPFKALYENRVQRKSVKMQLLNKFQLCQFNFLLKIVVLKAPSYSRPISNFKHLQQRSFFRSSRSQMFFKQVFLKILQISQENTCAGVSYKVASLQGCSFTKKRLLHRCFPVKFEKF